MNTRLLLALAAILITNSHLEQFYPSPLLAGDGHLGNAIFFMVAGLGITLSGRKTLRSFPEYLWRRIKRIYPTVFVAVTAFILLPERAWTTWDWQQFLAIYVWPTPWAFIEYVMVFYIAFYVLLRFRSAQLFLWMFGVGVILFAGFWYLHPQSDARLSLGSLHESIWWVFWAQMMLLGGFIGMRDTQWNAPLSRKIVLLAAGLVVYLALKALFVTGRVASFHFLLFGLVALLAYGLSSIADSSALTSALIERRFIASLVDRIAALTLEIYVVQGFLVHRDDLAHALPFPLNIVYFWSLLLVIAWILHLVVATITRERRERPALT